LPEESEGKKKEAELVPLLSLIRPETKKKPRVTREFCIHSNIFQRRKGDITRRGNFSKKTDPGEVIGEGCPYYRRVL